MSARSTLSTAINTQPYGRVFKAYVDGSKRIAKGFITLEERDERGEPVRDYDGDFVHAAGGICESNPFVNWDHGIVIGYGDKPVLKSVVDNGQTLTGLVGTSTIAQRAADLANVDLSKRDYKGKAVGRWAVNDCLAAAEDVWPLIRDGLAPGLSMEFTGLPNGVEGGRKSLVSGREQRVYHRYTIHGWAHTPQPTNRIAQLFEPEQVEKAWRDLSERGRSPLIRKSMTELLAGLPTRSKFVPVTPPARRKKSMEPVDDPTLEPVDDAGAATATMPPPEEQGPPEATDSYDTAQACSDFAAKLNERAKKTLHGKSRKMFAKAADILEKLAADLVSHGEGVESEVAGAAPEDDSETPDDDDSDMDDDGEGTDEFEDDDEPEPLQKSFTGELILKGGYRPRRYKASELRDPIIPTDSVVMTRDKYDALMKTFQALKQCFPKR